MLPVLGNQYLHNIQAGLDILQGVSEIIKGSAIEKREAALQIHFKYRRGKTFGQITEPCFTLTQSVLYCLSFGYVRHEGKHMVFSF